jgi:hypothetical protein
MTMVAEEGIEPFTSVMTSQGINHLTTTSHDN